MATFEKRPETIEGYEVRNDPFQLKMICNLCRGYMEERPGPVIVMDDQGRCIGVQVDHKFAEWGKWLVLIDGAIRVVSREALDKHYREVDCRPDCLTQDEP